MDADLSDFAAGKKLLFDKSRRVSPKHCRGAIRLVCVTWNALLDRLTFWKSHIPRVSVLSYYVVLMVNKHIEFCSEALEPDYSSRI